MKPKLKASEEVIPSEDDEQITFVEWLKLKQIRHFHIPNGGLRSIRQAVKFKRLGVSPGVPDIFIPVPRGSYCGLFIEMKRKKGGKVSPEQWDWINFLREKKYCTEVARGCDEAIEIVKFYLG